MKEKSIVREEETHPINGHHFVEQTHQQNGTPR